MATLSRHEARAVLEDGRSRFAALLDRLTPDDLDRPATMGGGDWSAKDLIGHVAFVEEIALVTTEAWLRGQRPPIEERFTTRDTDGQNAWNQDRKRWWPLDRIRADWESTHQRLVSAIEAMTDEEWASPRAFEGDEAEDLRTELGGVLGAPGLPFGHVFAHLPDLEAYVRSLNP